MRIKNMLVTSKISVTVEVDRPHDYDENGLRAMAYAMLDAEGLCWSKATIEVDGCILELIPEDL